ncbi:MAG: ribbon-helix-helix protein, CopG family [Streptosporangiaceae bacterium]
MVSVRLEAQILRDLRQLAEERGESISDLLRQAAVELIERSRQTAVLVVLRPVGGQQAIPTVLTAGRQATSGVSTSGESPVSSGSEHVSVVAG